MSFLEPLAFVFASLYGVLILFYLWERWRRHVAVPSLLLWESVREDTIRARRFRPDLLFMLQLLLLSCLIVGLAHPYVRDPQGDEPKRRRILILDTSASMQTRERHSSRFEEAQQQALDLIDGLPAGDEVMLISAGHTPEVVVNYTRDHDATRAALQHLAPLDVGGDLSLAIAFANGLRQRSDLPTDVDVFTDIRRSQLPEPLRNRVSLFEVGETDDNLGIEGLQIYQGRFQDYREARAYIMVENFAHREGHGFLTVRLEDHVVTRNGFTIPARETKGFLVHDFPGPGRVSAQLEVNDALSADNVAFGWIHPVVAVQVLFVSPPSPLAEDLQRLAAAAPALQFRSITPDEFATANWRADIGIFHRFVPAAPPTMNALYVYPPADNSLFPVAADATNIEVIDWNARHPALQSLRPLASLPLQKARIVPPPAWAETLLWSRTVEREFPLTFAGEHGGHRLACITFDLESERLLNSDNVNFLLFFMNLLGWLTPEHSETAVVATGDVHRFAPFPAQPVTVRDPHGGLSTLPPNQTVLEPLVAGEYRISSDGTRRTVLANFFDPVESDIGRASREPAVSRAVDNSVDRRTHAAEGLPRREYSGWLYAAAAVLLVLEWIAARRRSQ